MDETIPNIGFDLAAQAGNCDDPITWNEAERLDALERYAILDTGREPEFDDVASLAADILNAPIAVINLIAADRQWFKAEVGIGTDSLPLDVSICRHAILQPGVFVVPDLSKDTRFDGNPLVHVAGGLRFYAGALLETPDGLPLGTVCVLDTEPRPEGVSERERRALKILASQTMARLELRRSEAIAKAQQARAEKHARRLSLLAKTSALLLSTSDPTLSLKAIFALVSDEIKVDFAFHYRCAGRSLHLVAAAGLTLEQENAASQIKFGETVCGIVAETRKSLYVTAIQASGATEIQIAKMLGIESYYSMPLLSSGDLLGTVSFGRKSGQFSTGELETLQTLSEQLANALERRSGDEALRALNADLEKKVIERTHSRGRSWAVSPDLMCAVNTEGRFEASNPAWQTVLGWSEQDLKISNIWDFLHPDDVERTRTGARLTQIGQAAVGFPNRYRCRDGSYRWISWVAVPENGLVYCTGRDVTAQIEQAAALAEQTKERDRVWLNSRDILVIGSAIGEIEVVNPAWTSVLGYEAEESIGVSFRDLVLPEDLEATELAVEAAGSGAELNNFQNRYRAKDGTARWISWRTRSEDGKIYGYGRDITADKERDAELDRAQEALRQSQKMEAMGQLTGGVAHDFNNLLTPIVGSLDMLQRRGIGNEREQRLIDGAIQSAERAKLLVQRLLAFAKRQPLQIDTVSVPELVRNMADLVASTTGPNITVTVDIDEKLPLVLAESNQLEMALLNLSVNARDAMPDGGTLHISATAATNRLNQNPDLPDGAYVVLKVTDTGSGMDEETLARATEPFFSTKGVGKGTGLGLSMVHGLVSQLGGALQVESQFGSGTTVSLWLPQSKETATPSRVHAALSASNSAGGTVLLVDDEELVLMSTADMLGELGYTVVEACSGEAALQLVDAGLKPDILITDHLMPGMNGVELARAVQDRDKSVHVLVASGYAEIAGLDADLPRLIKPFRRDEIAASLIALVGES